MGLDNQRVRDAIVKLHEHIQKASGYNDSDSTSLPWFIVRDDDEDGIYASGMIIYDKDEPMLNDDQEYVTLMHPRVGDKLATLLSKLDQHIGSGMAYSTSVVQAMIDLSEELLRNINEEDTGESAENPNSPTDGSTD